MTTTEIYSLFQAMQADSDRPTTTLNAILTLGELYSPHDQNDVISSGELYSPDDRKGLRLALADIANQATD